MAQSTTPMHLDRIVGVSHEGEQDLFEVLISFFSGIQLVLAICLFTSHSLCSTPHFQKFCYTPPHCHQAESHCCFVSFCLRLKWLPGVSLKLSFAFSKDKAGQKALCSMASRSRHAISSLQMKFSCFSFAERGYSLISARATAHCQGYISQFSCVFTIFALPEGKGLISFVRAQTRQASLTGSRLKSKVLAFSLKTAAAHAGGVPQLCCHLWLMMDL